MGLGQWIQRTVGLAGGVSVGLAAPKVFDWPDQVIPVTVTVTGHKSEPRTITELEFVLSENEVNSSSDDSSSSSQQFIYRWPHKQLIELSAGQTLSFDINVVLPKPMSKADLGITEGMEGKGFVERMMEKGVMAAATLPESIHRYKLSVEAKVEGTKMPVRDSQNIFHRSVRRTTFGIGGLKFG